MVTLGNGGQSLLLFALTWWSTFFGELPSAQSYRSADDYLFTIGKDENLYDTGTLPDGDDVTVYLFRDEPRSYFLPLDGQSSPASITVVPCSSIVEWKVYFHAKQNHHDKRDSLEGDPLFLQQAKSDVESGDRPDGSNNRHLYRFEGSEMATFKTNSHLPKGIIRLVLVSKERNSRVQIYASSAPRHTDAAIPLLPDDAGIVVAANDRHSVTVAWQQSPSHRRWGQHIHYCVAFNPRRNYATLCSLRADTDGEVPPEWPKYAGFGFRWEDAAKRRYSAARRDPSYGNSLRRRLDINFACVGSRHWASVTTLLPNRTYHVDVFAINRLTNRSSAYAGTQFVTASRSPPLPVLKSGTPTTVHFGRGSVGHHVTYAYESRSATRRLVLFVQTSRSCARSGQITVDFVYEGAVLMDKVAVVSGLEKLVVKNAAAGNYSVRLNWNAEDARGSAPVRICLTGRGPKRCPYSGTPKNRAINATADLSSCRSVTLQWPSADVHAKYCIYYWDVAAGNGGQEDDDEEEETCGGDDDGDGDDGAERVTLTADAVDDRPVFCRSYKKTSPQRDGKKIVETVWDLKANARYKFRIRAVLKRGVAVDYEPVFVDTRDKC